MRKLWIKLFGNRRLPDTAVIARRATPRLSDADHAETADLPDPAIAARRSRGRDRRQAVSDARKPRIATPARPGHADRKHRDSPFPHHDRACPGHDRAESR